MRRISYLLIIPIFLLSCNKDHGPFVPTSSYPGALDSISVYTGDSAQMNIANAGRIKFSYDSQKRIDKMVQYDSKYLFFSYSGVSDNPSSMIDSSIYNNTAFIQTHQLSYNAQGWKTRDSITSYCIMNLSTNQRVFPAPTTKIKTFTYQPGQSYMLPDNKATLANFTYFDGNNDLSSYAAQERGFEHDTVSSYYADENPFYKLNIKSAIIDNEVFFFSSFYPLYFDISQSSHIFKQYRGKNDTYYRYSGGERTFINCYYDKDATGNINTMVLPNAGYSGFTGSFFGKFYTNLKFHYHPL